MKFTSSEDIESPIERVFEQVTNFETFERNAIRRGAEVERLSESTVPAVGMSWKARFEMRGRLREVLVKLTELEQPTALRLDGEGKSMNGNLLVDLLPLSPKRTRLTVALELEPKTLSARLLLQSLKLAKTSLNRRFRTKMREFTKAF